MMLVLDEVPPVLAFNVKCAIWGVNALLFAGAPVQGKPELLSMVVSGD